MSPYSHGVRESWRVSTAQVPRKHAPVQTGFDFESLSLSQYLLLFQGTNILCTFVRYAGFTSLEDVSHLGSLDCAQCGQFLPSTGCLKGLGRVSLPLLQVPDFFENPGFSVKDTQCMAEYIRQP